jgi:inhibitor of KinA sporulation pathway (predicted exonuclease)
MTTADDTRVSHPASKPLGCKSQTTNSAAFLTRAIQVVVDNFNRYRKPERSPALTIEDVNMMWFTQGRIDLKAMFSSAAAKGILWLVTFDNNRDEMYLEVFNKMKNQRIPRALMGETA